MSISTNRLLYFMDFNSYQSVVYSASLKDGKRLPGKVRNIANPQVADTKDYWFLDHFVNIVKVPFGEKTEINFWHSY